MAGRLSPLEVIRCSGCSQELAYAIPDGVIIKRYGLEAVATGLVSLKCPQCKRIWRPPGVQALELVG